MSSSINMVLADCEKQAKQLVEEITKYKSVGAISDQTANSLKSLCASLTETQKCIEPFTKIFARRVLFGICGGLFVNFALLVAILIILLGA